MSRALNPSLDPLYKEFKTTSVSENRLSAQETEGSQTDLFSQIVRLKPTRDQLVKHLLTEVS